MIERGVANAVLGNRLYWYLMVEVKDRMVGKMYGKVAFKFMERLEAVCHILASAVQTTHLACSPRMEPLDVISFADKASSWLRSRLVPKTFVHPKIPARKRLRNYALMLGTPNTDSPTLQHHFLSPSMHAS